MSGSLAAAKSLSAGSRQMISVLASGFLALRGDSGFLLMAPAPCSGAEGDQGRSSLQHHVLVGTCAGGPRSDAPHLSVHRPWV
jgi:hypothetical protein